MYHFGDTIYIVTHICSKWVHKLVCVPILSHKYRYVLNLIKLGTKMFRRLARLTGLARFFILHANPVNLINPG